MESRAGDKGRTKVLVHDFAGHPFQADLSRQLARNGYQVIHGYCGGVTTGRGDLAVHVDDPPGLSFVDLHPSPFERYSFGQRLRAEIRYGRSLSQLIRRSQPDVVISGNTPLLSQVAAWRTCASMGIPHHYWLQDFLGIGTRRTLTRRSALLGATAGRTFERIEVELLRRSTSIVAISEDFTAVLDAREIDVPTAVIENWAPIPTAPDQRAVAAWRQRVVPKDLPIVLYAGTLGLKHNPEHLVRAARAIAGQAWLVVITEGLGRDYLESQKAEGGLDNLVLLDYLPFEELPVALNGADVCLTLLEAEAGSFSVPSKVLTYLASGRPIVAAMPASNLATRIITDAQAGAAVDADDGAGFAAAVLELVRDDEARKIASSNAEAYSTRLFDVETIATNFETVFKRSPSRRETVNA